MLNGYLIPKNFNIMRPTFLSLPLLVKGIPMFFDILPLTPEMPNARFHENDKPNLRLIYRL